MAPGWSFKIVRVARSAAADAVVRHVERGWMCKCAHEVDPRQVDLVFRRSDAAAVRTQPAS